ncbi:MAG TPA: vanadium-dependent haloperoxidase [Verrucomicrobiota bacterium]|nr:vanadium-dependent haloperoxidase [Verrucomicrobiota bacterium]
MKTYQFFLQALGLAPLIAAQANVISDWNLTASTYLIRQAESHYARGMTMVSVAQFDAVNAVVGGYLPYALEVVAPGASPEAAAAQAAYTVLTNVSRANVSALDTALNQSLAAVADGPAKDAGLQLGRLAADRIIRLRAADNPNLVVNPPTSTAAGKWRLSPPNTTSGIGANNRYQLTWTLRSPADFRPGPPPALTSAQYAADLDEVRRLGAINSTERTPDQTEAANFHFGIEETFVRTVLTQRTLPLIETARAIALCHMAAADGVIAFYEAQYAYSSWRPYTAIRLAGTDGNDATEADPAWEPLLGTPNHPEYPSGTCTLTAALVEALIASYGDDFSFTGTWTGAPKPRNFARLSAALDDAVIARIAAGAHFRTSCETGIDLGRRIARHALANYLRPLPRLAAKPRAPGQFEFLVDLHPAGPLSYAVESSNDLQEWRPWHTDILGITAFTDPDGIAEGRRFYRVVPWAP